MPSAVLAQRGRDADVAGDGSDPAPRPSERPRDGLARPHRTFGEAADWVDAVLREPREPRPLRVGDDAELMLRKMRPLA